MTHDTVPAAHAIAHRSLAYRLQTLKSQSGIEIWFLEDHTRPLVTMSFGFKGGAAQDPIGKAGVSSVLAAMLTEGAGPYDSGGFHRALDDRAIELDFQPDHDNLRGTMRTLSRHVADAVEMLALAVQRPHFDPDALELVRQRLAGVLRSQANNPDNVADRLFHQIGLADHPYARAIGGDLASLATIGVDDLRVAHARLAARNTLRVAIVGDLDARTAIDHVDTIFGSLPATAERGAIQMIAMTALGTHHVTEIDVPQSTIRFGRPGIPRHDRDFVVALVVNHCFGGGTFSSRLFKQLREARGLCYSVYSYNAGYDHAASFVGATTVKNERVAETIDVIAQEIVKITSHGLSADDLIQAKSYLIGSYALRFDSSVKVAGHLLAMQLSDYAIDWLDQRSTLIEAVSADDVSRVVTRLFGDGRLLVAIAGRPIMS